MHKKASAGFSLVSVLVGAGVAGTVAMVLAATLSNFSDNMAKLSQKMELLNAENMVRDLFTNSQVCGCNLRGLRFDSGNPSATVPMNSVFSGCDNGNPPRGVNPLISTGQYLPGMTAGIRIENIYLQNFTATPGIQGAYRAQLVLRVDPATLRMALRPPTIDLSISADDANPSQAIIQSCSSLGMGGGSLPEGNCVTRVVTISGTRAFGATCNRNQNGNFNCQCVSGEKLLTCIGMAGGGGGGGFPYDGNGNSIPVAGAEPAKFVSTTARDGGCTIAGGSGINSTSSVTSAILVCCK